MSVESDKLYSEGNDIYEEGVFTGDDNMILEGCQMMEHAEAMDLKREKREKRKKFNPVFIVCLLLWGLCAIFLGLSLWMSSGMSI